MTWTPVSERLPEPFLPHFPDQSRHVLVYRGGESMKAYYRFDLGRWYTPWFSHMELLGVTHWMPLPGPPEV